MAIRNSSNVGGMNFVFTNPDHQFGKQFPHVEGNFTASFWVSIREDEQFRLWSYEGQGVGAPYISFESITEDGGQEWRWRYGSGDNLAYNFDFGDITPEGWFYICYRRTGNLHQIFILPDPGATLPGTLLPAHSHTPTTPIVYQFGKFLFVQRPGVAVCAMKFWNVALTDAQVLENARLWGTPTGAVAPIWNCPLRRPGDLLNSEGTFPNDFWHDNFEWTEALDMSQLVYFTDPIPLQRAECQTILIPNDGVEGALPTVNEFQAPVGTTTKYSPDATYFQIENRSTVPVNYATTPIPDRTQITSIVLYGFPPYQGPNKQVVPTNVVGASATYLAYVNELGVKTETQTMLDMAGFVIPPATFPEILPLYEWKLGAGFTWINNFSAITKALVAEFRQSVIVVKYIGTWILETPEISIVKLSQLPIEVILGFPGEDINIPPPPPPPPPPRVLTIGGIYFFNPLKSAWHDQYYVTEAVPDGKKKIPDPTIKTALIGE